MKKQLLKLTLLTFVVLFSASTVQAQALYSVDGKYKLSTADGAVDPVLYMTVNDQGALVWDVEKSGDDPSQVWTVQNHRTPAGAGFVEIFATLPGVGPATLTTGSVEADHPNYTLSVAFREPKTVAYTAPNDGGTPDDTSDDTPAVYSGDLSGLDQFQRRRTGGITEGNNALFIKTPWGGNSRYGIPPTAAGESVLFDGAGIDVLQYHLVEANTANVNTFGIDAFSISNPVNSKLTIKGATSKVKEISVFSVLGNKVLSKSLNNVNGEVSLNVSSLSTGLYIVQMVGNEGERFTKKIIKQ